MKTIRINMRTQKIISEEFDTNTILGNRGLTAKTLTEEVDPKCDPLGEGNKLIFATGIFAGFNFPTGNRLSAGAKSPLTGAIKESNVGGTAGANIAAHGIKMIVIEDIPESDSWYIVRISGKADVTLEPADKFLNKGTYESTDDLLKTYGGKSTAVCVIGPAGERMYKTASIQVTDYTTMKPTRACGRGGMGAVMGSKHIKAIVIEKPSERVEFQMADAALAKSIIKELYINNKDNPHPFQNAGTYGNSALTMPMNAYPVQNFSGRVMTDDERAKVDISAYIERINKFGGKQGVTCQSGCPALCSNYFNDKDGKLVTSGLEYETIAMAGPNCNIYDWDYLAEFDHICDDIGVDTIDIANAISVTMDAGRIPWGDIAEAQNLLKELAEGTKYGRILGNGTQAVGDYLKHKRVPTCKGQALPAYDPRAVKGMGVTYATSRQGADHTAGFTLLLPIDHSNPDIQCEASKNTQIAMALVDNIGCINYCCAFLEPEYMSKLASLITAIYGIDYPAEMLMGIGYQTCMMEQSFNSNAGLTADDDILPEFFQNEPLEMTNQVFDVEKDCMGQMWT